MLRATGAGSGPWKRAAERDVEMADAMAPHAAPHGDAGGGETRRDFLQLTTAAFAAVGVGDRRKLDVPCSRFGRTRNVVDRCHAERRRDVRRHDRATGRLTLRWGRFELAILTSYKYLSSLSAAGTVRTYAASLRSISRHWPTTSSRSCVFVPVSVLRFCLRTAASLSPSASATSVGVRPSR